MTTDAQILTALRADQDGVSGAELSQRLGVSRAAIWARECSEAQGKDVGIIATEKGWNLYV